MVPKRVGFAKSWLCRGELYILVNGLILMPLLWEGVASFLFLFPCFWFIETGSGIGQARLECFILLRLALNS